MRKIKPIPLGAIASRVIERVDLFLSFLVRKFYASTAIVKTMGLKFVTLLLWNDSMQFSAKDVKTLRAMSSIKMCLYARKFFPFHYTDYKFNFYVVLCCLLCSCNNVAIFYVSS